MKDKVVLITGASSGIGKALALKFAREGSKVVLGARSLEQLAAVGEEIRKAGGAAHWLSLDVTQQADCERFVAEAVKVFGRVDILVNNAGISMRALFQDLDVDVIERVMQVNFFGTVYCTRAAIDQVVQNRGSIIGISSIAGYRGLPGRSGYSASKFAMHGFLESLRTELLRKGVHVLLACPGFTESNIRKVALKGDGSQQSETPLKEDKLMSAETVADHIYRAVVRRKRSITLTGQGKLTVFLNKWFPKFMDKMVFNHFAKEPDSPLR
ncbi:MAG TPA: SDR family oxidoreductase [Bacteroidia bacterium]|nr:SDR family oxidoreductase [Bacteroidia bacterium]